MTRSLPTRLLAALCILAFGLSQAVSSLGVRCRDSVSGEIRLELVCVKSVRGGCVTATNEYRGATETHIRSSPCQDEPIGQPGFFAKLIRSTEGGGSGFIAIPGALPDVTMPYGWSATIVACPLAVTGRHGGQPPGSLACLRTVILRV